MQVQTGGCYSCTIQLRLGNCTVQLLAPAALLLPPSLPAPLPPGHPAAGRLPLAQPLPLHPGPAPQPARGTALGICYVLMITGSSYLGHLRQNQKWRTSDASTGNATAGAASASSRSVTASGLHSGGRAVAHLQHRRRSESQMWTSQQPHAGNICAAGLRELADVCEAVPSKQPGKQQVLGPHHAVDRLVWCVADGAHLAVESSVQ